MKVILQSLFLLILSFGCTKSQTEKKGDPIPVEAARALSKEAIHYIDSVGHMEAYQSVQVMAQVSGYLMKSYIEDGADVKAGDLLFEIDERPYLAKLEEANSLLEKQISSLGYAKRSAERNAQLAEEAYISADAFDQLKTQIKIDDAAVKEAMAQVEQAKINLDFTKIYAPLDARAGERLLNDGNLITDHGAQALLTLNQITPIYATFFINEKDLPLLQRKLKTTKNLKVIAMTDQASKYEGELTFIDNEIDSATGMIKLKATYPNKDKLLWPNQYVKLRLILETLEDAILIPHVAVQTSSKGDYVYVIKGNQTVEIRGVTLGQRQEGNSVEVKSGLKAGEKVVTIGHMMLYPGAKVASQPHEDAR